MKPPRVGTRHDVGASALDRPDLACAEVGGEFGHENRVHPGYPAA